MRIVGVPVGFEHFKRGFLQEVVNGEPAELIKALVPMEDAQASFQILRLSAASRLSHLLCTVPPSITYQAAAFYDDLVERALASIIAGDGAAAEGLPNPEEVAHDSPVCQKQAPLGHEALRQTYLPIRAGGLGLPAAALSKAWPTSVATCWSWDVSSMPQPGGTFHPFLNGCLSNPWRQRSLKS